MASDNLTDALRRLMTVGGLPSPFAVLRKARVIAANDGGGTADAMHARYSVDVQPMTLGGGADENWPVIRDVELPLLWAGPNRGVFALPAVGAVVRLGFYEADPGQPYIDAAVAEGGLVPVHPQGSLLIQQGPGTAIEIMPTGQVNIKSATGVQIVAGAGAISRVATEAWVLQVFDTHTHPSPAGPTSPPTPIPHAGLSPVRVSHE